MFAAAAIVVALVTGLSPSHAFNPRVYDCRDPVKTYQFDHRWGEDWMFGSTSLDDVIHAGIQRLNTPRKQNGTRLATVTRLPDLTSGTQTADVLISRVAMTHAGSASCGTNGGQSTGDIIRINAGITGNNARLERLGVHEMLHLMGMQHGGSRDSFLPGITGPAQVPTRSSTCNTASQNGAYYGLSVDDLTLLSWLHDPAAERQLGADTGFEAGYSSIWDTAGLSIFGRVALSGASGSYRQKIQHDAFDLATSFAQQRNGVLTGNTRPKYRVSAAVGRRSSSYDLDIKIRLLARTVQFQGNNGCDYASGGVLEAVDPNDSTPTTGSWIARATTTYYNLPTGWQTRSTSWWTAPAAHQIDTAARITGRSESAGDTPSYYWLDNFTVEED